MMVDIELINDLKKGGGLDEVLTKHNTNLKEIFDDLNHYPAERVQRTPDSEEWRNIHLTKSNTFRIMKTVNKHREFYGTYKSFEDAKKVKSELIKCNWDPKKLDRILAKHNIRKQGSKHKKRR